MRFFSEKRTANLFEKITGLLGLFLIFASLFTACENFLQGEDVMNEINKVIEYNNSKSHAINVEVVDDSCGKIKTPATGEITKKVTDVFSVRFEPAADHQFIKWEAVIKDLGVGEKASDYIEFENEESLESRVTFKKASGKTIVIRPVCPAKLTYSFYQGGGEVYPRDSTIEFNFNEVLGDVKLQEFVEDYVTISNLPEGITAATYFHEPVIRGKTIKFRADTSNGYIPVTNNTQRVITVRIPKESIWYINEQYSEPVKVYLDADIKETYLIGPETSTKTKFKYVLPQEDDNPIGSLKIDGEDNDGKVHGYSVNQNVTLRYKMPSGYTFKKWKFTDSTGKELSDSDLSLVLDEEISNNICQLSFTIDNYMSEVITVTPLCYENLTVEFNLDDEEKIYNRDSDIELTFNKPLIADSKDKVIIKIPGLEEGKKATDYFEEPVLTGNKLTIKAKNIGKDGLIPLLMDGTNTVTVTLPAGEILYEVQTTAGEKDNIGLASDTIFTYKINDQTKNKTKLRFDSTNIHAGTFKVDGIQRDNSPTDYSIDSKIQLTYTLTKTERRDYFFKKWKITRPYTGEDGESYAEEIDIDDEDRLEELHISFVSSEQEEITGACVYSAVLNIDDSISELLVVEPVSIFIEEASITINGGDHGISTDNGIHVYKQGESNHIEFKTDSAWAFIRWQLVNSVTGNEIPKSIKTGKYPYISSDNLDNEKMDFIVIDEVPDTMIEIGDPDDEEDDVEVALQLEFRPVVVERPQIISNLPINGSAVRKDTSVQVMFDYDMDWYSIYYTQDEIAALVEKLGLECDDNYDETSLYLWCYGKGDYVNPEAQLLYDCDNGEYFGYMYTQNGKKEYVYKNISIINTITGENLISYYDPPYFENARTLSLKVHRDYTYNNGVSNSTVALPRNTQLLVAINENMFYDQDGKNITMNGSKKWIYQVNDDTDEKGPHQSKHNGVFVKPVMKVLEENLTPITVSTLNDITVADIESDGVTIKNSSENTKLKYLTGVLSDSKLSFYVDDREGGSDGSGIAYTFYLRCTQLYDVKYNKVSNAPVRNVGLSSNSIGQTAEFDGSLAGLYSYLSSGVYSVELVFVDVCGNESIYDPELETVYDPRSKLAYDESSGTFKTPRTELNKKWCICIDKSAPSMDGTNLSITGKEEALELAILSPTKDYEKFEIRYRTYNPVYGTITSYEVLTPDANGKYKIENLLPGYRYQTQIRYYDKKGNVSSSYNKYAYVKPGRPTAVSINNDVYGTTPTITATRPDGNGYCSHIRIRYRETGTSNWTSYNTPAVNPTISQTISSGKLTNGKTYEFEICAYYSSSGLYSEPYKDASGNYPTYTTTPSAVALSSVSYNNAQKSLKLNYTAPTSNYTAIKILYSTNSSFTSPGTITRTPSQAASDNGSYTITGLSAGTKYYVKVIAYYSTEDNMVESAVKSAYTMPSVANNNDLYIDDAWCNYIDLCWDGMPSSGDRSGYEIWYKLYSNTTYTKIATLDKDRENYWIGEYEDGTMLEGGKAYDFKVVTYINDTDNNTTVSNYSYAPTYRQYMVPYAPSNLTAEKLSDSSFKVTWTKPSKGTFTGYNLRYGTSSSISNSTVINITNTNTTIYTVSGVAKEYYYIWVQPYVIINSGKTNTNPDAYNSNASTRCSLALDAVTNLSATYNSSNPTTSINLSWKVPSSTTGYDGIEVWRKTNGSADSTYTLIAATHKSTLSKTATSYTDTGLAINTKYNYKVVTYKGSSSTASGALKAENVISRCTMPYPVTGFSATVQSPNKVTLKWTNPTNSNYYKNIKVYRDSTCVATLAKGMTSYDVTGLTGATLYTFYVKTTNNDDNICTNNPTELTRLTSTSPVTGLSTYSREKDSITVSWNKPAGNFTGYYCYYKLSTSSSWTGIGYYDSTYTQIKKTGLTAGTSYDFRVDAYYNDGGTYRWSSSTTTSSSTRAEAPTNFKISSQSDNRFYLTWTNPSSGYDNVYIKYKKATDSSYSEVKISKGNTGYYLYVDYGTRYEIYACALYSGWGSSTGTIKAQTYPATPTNLVINSNEGYVTATWTPTNLGENKYKIAWHKDGESWTISDCLSGTDSCSLWLDKSTKYTFAVFAQNDFTGYGNNLRSSDCGYPTYVIPPANISSITVTSSGSGSNTKWTCKVNNWSTLSAGDARINVYLDGVYQSGVNSSTGEFSITGNYSGHTLTFIPYHTKNSGHRETLEKERIYDGSNKTLQVWDDETYAYRFTIRSLSTGTKYGD